MSTPKSTETIECMFIESSTGEWSVTSSSMQNDTHIQCFYDEPGYFSVQAVRYPAGPYNGGFEVEPLYGLAYKTKFVLNASGWVSDDPPLKYEFYSLNESASSNNEME